MKNSFARLAFVASLAAVLFTGCGKPTNSIRIITEATFPPYEFLRGTEIVGIDVEISRAIAKELGKELVIEDAKFDSVIPSLISGKADIAAAGITVTEDRKAKVAFSVPYVSTGVVIIYKKATPFLKGEEAKGKKVGVQSGTTSDTYCVDVLKQEPERFDSPSAAVAALKAGKVDLVIADIDPAKNCVKGEADLALSDFVTREDYAVAIRKGDPEFLAVVNKVITRLKESGELDAIIAKYTAEADQLKDVD